MTRFDPKAITFAMLLSLALDVLGGALLLAIFGAELVDGGSADQLRAAIGEISQSTGYQLASLLYSSFTTAVGGYVAARRARAYPYFNALAVGVLSLLLGVLMSGDAPWWFDLMADLGSVPAALLGGDLGRRHRKP